MLNLMGLMC